MRVWRASIDPCRKNGLPSSFALKDHSSIFQGKLFFYNPFIECPVQDVLAYLRISHPTSSDQPEQQLLILNNSGNCLHNLEFLHLGFDLTSRAELLLSSQTKMHHEIDLQRITILPNEGLLLRLM